jgi:hypothetical protein
MNASTKGLLGLVLWLIAGFAFTEVTALALNAWLMHRVSTHSQDGVSALQPEPAHD